MGDRLDLSKITSRPRRHRCTEWCYGNRHIEEMSDYQREIVELLNVAKREIPPGPGRDGGTNRQGDTR